MKIIAALTVFGVLALASAGASVARGDGKPPFGVPDPARLVLRPADVGGAQATAQGYYQDKGFVSAYGREFSAPVVGKTRLTWLASDVEVALIPSDARDYVTAFHQVAGRSSGRAALRQTFAGLDLRGVSISGVEVLPPKPLTGTDGWDVEAHFKLNGLPAQGHVAFFSAGRFLGELFAVGVRWQTLSPGAVAQLGRLLTRRFRAVPLPKDVTPPTISGTLAIGQTLTASPGTWANGPIRYRFGWSRCTATACNLIQG